MILRLSHIFEGELDIYIQLEEMVDVIRHGMCSPTNIADFSVTGSECCIHCRVVLEEMWLLITQGRNVWGQDMEAFARQLAGLLGAWSGSQWPWHSVPSETDRTAALRWYVDCTTLQSGPKFYWQELLNRAFTLVRSAMSFLLCSSPE